MLSFHKFFIKVIVGFGSILLPSTINCQNFTSFEVISYDCSSLGPPAPDTLIYSFTNDTLNIRIIKWGHACAKPNTIIDLAFDTIKFIIQDTATIFCTADCMFEYTYSLYGFPGNFYIAEVFEKNYVIDRTVNKLHEKIPRPFFEKQGNIIKLNNLNSDFKVNIYDIRGSLNHSYSSKVFNTSTLKLTEGIYFFQILFSGEQITQKIFID